jgi:serine/threonine protein kinase
VTEPEGKEEFPSQFSRYTLVERLAMGGMAEVFKAKILSAHGFEKLLVIKRILPHLAADKTFVAMFIDEGKLTAQLVHPKIVQVTDFGEVNGQYFIALEFVDGFDALALLRASAQRQVRLPIPLCMFIAMEVLDALDYAHNAKHADGKPMRIVHRDISPSNVFISRRGDVKLGDFGIAHAQERESKTQAGTLKGKYGYMSPEQVVGGGLDARSDLFAVGIVLAEMIMGRRLFSAPNDLDVLLMVRDGKLDRLDKYCKDLPPELDEVLRKSLRRKVNDRFQSAAEFRDALADLLFRMGFRVGPSDVGRIASDYFDPSPDALARLNEQARRLRVRAPTAVYAAVSNGEVTAPTPPAGGNSQRFEWGVAPGQATVAPRASTPPARSAPPTAYAEAAEGGALPF